MAEKTDTQMIMDKKKPTIKELEKILEDLTERPIIVQPDGSIKVDRRRKGKGFILTGKRPLISSY